MADFYGALETTSFRVKDREQWLLDDEVQAMKAIAESDGFFHEQDGYWSFGYYGQYPSWWQQEYDDATGEEGREWSFLDVIERHILPGDVCQISVSGSEKLRYIGGPMAFVTSKGSSYFNAETCWETKLTEEDLHRIVEDFVSATDAIVGHDLVARMTAEIENDTQEVSDG